LELGEIMAPRRAVIGLIALAFGLLLAPAGAKAAQVYFIELHTTRPDGGPDSRFSLERVNPDGTGRETVVPDVGPAPLNNSLALYGDRLYWRDYQNETRAATTSGVLLGPTPAPDPHVAAALYDRVLDAAGVYTYFGHTYSFFGDVPDAIMRTRDGGENETFVPTRQFSPPASVALDEAAGKIYWAGAWNNQPSGLVQRADLADGSHVESLVEGFTLDDYHVDLALDPGGGKLYLGNNGLGKIQRANLDGTGLEDIVTGTYVFAIAVDPAATPEPGTAGVAGLCGAWLLVRRRRSS
jgi:MYXO-CTERM domain-containing protein